MTVAGAVGMHGRLDVVETGLLITAGQLSGITLEEGNYLRSTVFLHCHTTAPTTTLDTHDQRKHTTQ